MAKAGLKVALFDRKLSPGGGMWGGAMMFNQLVIQQEALHIIRDFDINYEPYEDGLYTADSVEVPQLYSTKQHTQVQLSLIVTLLKTLCLRTML